MERKKKVAGYALLAVVVLVAAAVAVPSLLTGCPTTSGSCQCQPTICPLHETASGCYCKVCSPNIFLCQVDSDCVIVDALCCSLADMVNPAAINAKYQDTWENNYRPNSCAGQTDSEELVKTSACAPGCGTVCGPMLKAVCKTDSGNNYCAPVYATPPDGGYPWTECVNSCRKALCDDAGIGCDGGVPQNG